MPIYSLFSWLFRSFSNFVKRTLTPKKRRNRYSKSLGFTLIEVLVVMIMVGILSAIAAPSWLAFVNNQRINASQTKIFQAIKVAQSDAKIRQSVASSTLRTRIVFTSGQTDGAYRIDNVRTGGGLQSLEPGVKISNVTSGSTNVTPTVGSSYPIEFDARGLLYDPSNQLVYPLCINLSVDNSTRVRWIAIKTLLGAVVTGSEGTCS